MEGPFECPCCDFAADDWATYRRHADTHRGRSKCKICQSGFPKISLVRQHVKKVHAQRSFQCDLCEYKGKQKDKLNAHMIQRHIKPYECEECHLRFGARYNLRLHKLNRHGGEERNYTCDVCGKRFKTDVALYVHSKDIHFPEAQICSVCGRMCASKIKYAAHKRACKRIMAAKDDADARSSPSSLDKVSARFHCTVCSASYSTKQCLKDHMNIHMKVKPYKCPKCPKTFASLCGVDLHKFVHRGKNYECDVCAARFNRNDNLKRHLKKTHAGVPLTKVRLPGDKRTIWRTRFEQIPPNGPDEIIQTTRKEEEEEDVNEVWEYIRYKHAPMVESSERMAVEDLVRPEQQRERKYLGMVLAEEQQAACPTYTILERVEFAKESAYERCNDYEFMVKTELVPLENEEIRSFC